MHGTLRNDEADHFILQYDLYRWVKEDNNYTLQCDPDK